MAEEFEKYAVLKNMFRRRSSTEFVGGSFQQTLDENNMSKALNDFGAHVDKQELHKTIETMGPQNPGKLNFDEYTKLCNQFVKEPTAVPGAMNMKFHDLNDFET